MSVIRLNTLSLEINLLQREEKSAESGQWLKPLVLTAVLVAGACGFGWLWNTFLGEKHRLESHLANLNDKISAQQSLHTQQASLPGGGASVPITQWLQTPEFLRAAAPQPAVLLDRLQLMLPEEADLISAVYAQDGKVEVTGSFADKEKVVAFLQEIRRSRDFTFVKLSGVNNRDPQSPEQVQLDPVKKPGSDPSSVPITQTTTSGAASEADTMPVVQAKFELLFQPLDAVSQGGPAS